MHDDIRAPSQARSRRTMDELYRSLDILLREKSFDRLTIADLAEHANVAVGSIYARFKDKNALLAGLYIRTCEQAFKCLETIGSPTRWRDKSDEEMVRSILMAVDRFYRREAHILNAAVIANVSQVDDSRVGVWQKALDEFSQLLCNRWPASDPAMLRRAIQIIIRFTTAAMHQAVMIEPVNRWKGRISNKQLLNELVRYSLDVLERSRSGTLASG